MKQASVVSLNVSEKKGTPKKPLPDIVIDGNGIVGDAHAEPGNRQVSLLAIESIKRFSASKRKTAFKPGEFAENITTQGIDLRTVNPLDRFSIGDVTLEVTQIGKKCHGKGCAVFKEIGKCLMPKEGIFCRVASGGRVRTGASIAYVPRELHAHIITLSDRASRGEYEDLSGPEIKRLLENHFKKCSWKITATTAIIPDDETVLGNELTAAIDAQNDIVITTGGTGVGPRDITPDVVESLCDRLVPGVIDAVRLKYGRTNPRALLSRSVAGMAGHTLLYALPGSVKAVQEYMREILKTTEHLIFMARGLGH